jgi:hypothetical protein
MPTRPWCWPHTDAKEGAAGTYKHTFGFHPLLACLDRGQAPGEPLAGILRPGNAAPGAADDLIALVDLALAQLPAATADRPILVRSDSAGASTRLAWHLRDHQVGFSLGMQIDGHLRQAILAQPEAGCVNGQKSLPIGGQQVSPLAAMVCPHRWPDKVPVHGHQFSPLAQLGSGITPLPAVACESRNDSPWVTQTWAWCSSRSTVAVASVLGISSSNPAGCRLLLTASARFS